MSTVHTEYGPGRIIAQETVRGRTRFKVAGEGFEVWLDQTKLGGYERPDEPDFDAPHWHGHHPDDATVYPEPHVPPSDDELAEYADPRGHFDRDRMRTHPDYLFDDDPDARYANRRTARGISDAVMDEDDPYAEGYDPEDLHGLRHRLDIRDFDEDDPARYSHRRQGGYAEDEMRGLSRGDYEGYDEEYDPSDEYRGLSRDPGLGYDDDPDSRYARKRTANPGLTGGDVWHDHGNEDAWYNGDFDEPEDLHGLRHKLHLDEYSDDDPARYSRKQVMRGKAGRPSHLAWAPMDDDNSTTLPYNPEPQHHAIGTPGDDESATIQPIHHIDADERLQSADSLTFDEADDADGPGPNPDLFAKEGAFGKEAFHPLLRQYIKTQFPNQYNNVLDRLEKGIDKVLPGQGQVIVRGNEGRMDAAQVGVPLGIADRMIDKGVDALSAGRGWGKLIHPASVHQANPAALVGPALRVLGPMALNGLMGDGGPGEDALAASDPGDWGGLIHNASYRPAGLSDRYIDITAGADYHNDPAAQFRHDPDAYINRVGHLMDEGLNPRFAEYMDLVEADSGVRTAAWKDVRAKAMRLKTSGAVHVKDIAPSRIMASVDGDHGTYDVVILKGASYGDQSIANWHCACEWGRWAFKRKFTYVGRLCSHAYASYLTMQSAAMKEQRPTRKTRGPSDMVIRKRDPRDRQYPMPVFAAGLRTADALQNGPERLTPELVVNDTDDAHMFLDVTKDERDDVGPDDVVSDKDIVHFARLMRHCEVTEQPYPRQLVAFLARYAGCADDADDDTQADYQAHDADDANKYLDKIRSDADRKQENDFGSMAERVHRIQDAVEEARAHGADADRFVAMVRTAEDKYEVSQDGGRTLYRGDGNTGYAYENGRYTPVNFTGEGSQGPEGNRYEMGQGGYSKSTENGRDLYRYDGGQGNSGFSVEKGNVRGVQFDGRGEQGSNQRFDYNGDADGELSDFQNFLKTNPSTPAVPKQPGQQQPGQQQPGQQQPGQQQPGNNQATQTVNKTQDNGAAANPGTSGNTAPSAPTSGTVSDGGRAGAENGNNAAITKNMLDADGMYTVQQGDTWTDLAQRTTGDMNNYQKMYDAQGGKAGGNIDDIAVGTKVNLKDFANDTGNAGLSGDITNPAGGGADGDIATVDTPKGSDSGAETALNAGTSVGVETGAASNPGSTTPQPPGGQVAQDAVPPPTTPKTPEPAAPPNGGAPKSSLRTARDWLRWAAESDGTTNQTAPTTEQPADAAASTSPSSGPSASGGSRSAPATNPAQTGQPGSPSASDVYDPQDPAEQEQQSQSAANPGAGAGGSNSMLPSSATPGAAGGMGMGDVGSMIGQGVGAATDIASGIGQALPGIVQGIGSIFASKQDFDNWVRYAYPADGGEDFDPKTMPHLPFAGSGNPGPLEFSTSEEYADKARKKMDDVTDLGDGDLTTPMGEWQKQGSAPRRNGLIGASTNYDFDPAECGHNDQELLPDGQSIKCHECGSVWTGQENWNPDDEQDPFDPRLIGASTNDDSDIVRRFQAHLGDTALGAGAGQGAGRFDDIAGAAQGFLRTAGRNYSLAEQSELIREGDKGGARNLDSLDLKGTHYEDMHTLGW